MALYILEASLNFLGYKGLIQRMNGTIRNEATTSWGVLVTPSVFCRGSAVEHVVRRAGIHVF